jgi:hypothetical protein
MPGEYLEIDNVTTFNILLISQSIINDYQSILYMSGVNKTLANKQINMIWSYAFSVRKKENRQSNAK